MMIVNLFDAFHSVVFCSVLIICTFVFEFGLQFELYKLELHFMMQSGCNCIFICILLAFICDGF